MKRSLFIPSKIRVGFQNRKDTFTGKLAYIIYYDSYGKIKKETSWGQWRDENIPALEIDNIIQGGYVLNKGVQRDGHWGSGRHVIRVHDPRDFEFEITVDNLIGILMHSDVSKRDITEPCVYAWAAGELVLLPVNSVDYSNSIEFTKKQSLKVKAKELVVGCRYNLKKNDNVITYLGRFMYQRNIYDISGFYFNGFKTIKMRKAHVFVDANNNMITPVISSLSNAVDDIPVDNVAFLIDQYFESMHAHAIVDVCVQTNPNELPKLDKFALCKLVDTKLVTIAYRRHATSLSQSIGVMVHKVGSIHNSDSITLEYHEYCDTYNHRYRGSPSNTYTSQVKHTVLDQLKTVNINDTSPIAHVYTALSTMGYGDIYLITSEQKNIKLPILF